MGHASKDRRGRAIVEAICQSCFSTFQTYPWEIERGRGKFCSYQCLGRYRGLKYKDLIYHGKNYHLKNKAGLAVKKAIDEGKLIRQSCKICGRPNAHAHHEDYAKPLKVKWLCPTHHNRIHTYGGSRIQLSLF